MLTNTAAGGTWSYVYDGAGRLDTATRGATVWDYGYDLNSNRTSLAKTGAATVTYGYNSQDQLTSMTGTTAPTYDGRGNTSTVAGVTLGWDASDRNTSLTSGAVSVSYARDSADRARTRTQGATVATDLYDGGGDAPIGLMTGATVAEWYVGLPGGVTRTVQAGTDTWLFPNIHGDTMATAGDSGVKTAGPFVYEPFGTPVTGGADVTALTAEYSWLGQHQKATETEIENITHGCGAGPFGSAQRLVETVEKQRAVRQLGQHVVKGPVPHFQFDTFA